MPTIVARRYDTLRPIELEIEAGPDRPDLRRLPTRATLPLVAPGLVDLQINGFGGIEFNDPRADD